MKYRIKKHVEGRDFVSDTPGKALDDCVQAGFRALSVPEIIDLRINASADSHLWTQWYTTASMRAVGYSKQGRAVIVYAHGDIYFKRGAVIRAAIGAGLENGAGVIPLNEFYAMLEREDGKSVFVVDYARVHETFTGELTIEKAVEHPLLVPFCGGEARARRYLQKCREMYGNYVKILHDDDVMERPLARLLYLGNKGALDSLASLESENNCLGIEETRGGLPLQELLVLVQHYVPKVAQGQFLQEVQRFYPSGLNPEMPPPLPQRAELSRPALNRNRLALEVEKK